MKKKFVIVGGSIAGSVCAILLDRLGFDVTIFEKSKNRQVDDRGAGIWLPEKLIHELIEKGILSDNFSYLSLQQRPIYTNDSTDPAGHLLTSHGICSAAVHWMDLYEDLKQHRPESHFLYDCEVTTVERQNDKVVLTINNTDKQSFDYCIFADGVRSLGRKFLFPSASPSFTNTIAWRGTLERDDIDIADEFLGKGTFYVCDRGHLLIYPVPNRQSKNPTQDYKLNWLFYENVDINHALFGGDIEKAKANVIKGHMTSTYRHYLHNLAKTYLPSFAQQVILATQEPFLQALHDLLIPSYVADNICLLGDASTLLRAHTAAGATKSIQDALALAKHLEINSDIRSALRAWNHEQYNSGKAQFHLGQRLGALFVTDMPDWQQISQQQLDDLWYTTIGDCCWYAKI